MKRPPKRFFEFGPFRLDAEEKILLREGEPLALTPKAFDILLTLVENHGRTVSTNELIDRVWADTFVEVGNLNRNISTLRSLLGDDTHHPTFIRTLPKRGYRFDAAVREILEEEEEFEIKHRTRYRVSVTESGERSVATLGILTPKRMGLLAATAVTAAITFGFALMKTESGKTTSLGSKPPVTRQQSLEVYENARRLWNDRSGESLHRATGMLERVVTSDPDFALGHAALADAYAFDLQNRTKSESEARRAIQLDPSLGQPHATIGFLRTFWDWNLESADEYFKNSIALDPNYATGHQWYALSLAAMGQGNESLAELKRARDLDPGSGAIAADLCRSLYFNQRMEEAEAECLRALQIDQGLIAASETLYDIYSASGKFDLAVEWFIKSERLAKRHAMFPEAIDRLRAVYAASGVRGYWKERIEMLGKIPRSNYQIAKYHARLGNRNAALASIRSAYDNRELDMVYFLSEPVFVKCCYQDERYWTFPPFTIQGHSR